jgi:hypothetical protein
MLFSKQSYIFAVSNITSKLHIVPENYCLFKAAIVRVRLSGKILIVRRVVSGLPLYINIIYLTDEDGSKMHKI